MIVGRGDIASVLTDRDDMTYFVSGVSNSRETREKEFRREIDLLLSQPRDKHIVYVSTLAIYYSNTPYTRHKVNVENIIRLNFNSYSIFRIGNITWGTNPNTLINFLKDNPDAKIQNVWRYLLDKKEFLHWIGFAQKHTKQEMNITGRLTWVPDLAKIIRQQREWNIKMAV